jgi:pseudouridylate synthase
MGPLSLPDDLDLGAWRRLTEEELEALTVFGIPLA